jgi:AraC-like DNA-binding protein
MGSGYTQTRSYREFFRIHAPAAAVDRAVDHQAQHARTSRAMVLNIDTGAQTAGEVRVELDVLPVIPFAAATKGLVSLAMDQTTYGEGQGIDLLLPRSAFDRVADRYGAARITSLSLPVGAAREDAVLAHLGASLEFVLSPSSASSTAMIDQVSLALNLHIAQRYGGLKPPRMPERGGLAPWQLRLARNAFDQNLDGGVSLDTVADACGLSASHFSRAFSRSTGVAPHRWLMRRRVEIAKDMIMERGMPLAQIALACGFSDQSHFTRTFATMTGFTPRRWRMSQHCNLASQSLSAEAYA